jgi:hypothetical protein
MLLCQPGSDTDGTHGKTINEIISNQSLVPIGLEDSEEKIKM